MNSNPGEDGGLGSWSANMLIHSAQESTNGGGLVRKMKILRMDKNTDKSLCCRKGISLIREVIPNANTTVSRKAQEMVSSMQHFDAAHVSVYRESSSSS